MRHAVRSTSRRNDSISIHESAIIACTICLRPSISPCVWRDTARSHIRSKARFTMPHVRMAWWMRPPPNRVWATRNASPRPPSMFSRGTRTSL